ncbi:iron ABC transporter permease [Anaerolineales bacterium HSG24]|nr:iron ABC transporter permease [Anaerolineales bacterium HSG24]
MKSIRPHLFAVVILLIPTVFLLLFYIYPLSAILKLSFAPQGQLDLTGLTRLVTTDYYLNTLWFTAWQATLSTMLTLIVALPSAYIFARYRFTGKRWLSALATIPFVLPTIVVANAFTVLLGPRGLINQNLMILFQLDQPPIDLKHTVFLILLAHVFYNYAIVLRFVGGFWANLDPALTEAARVLGASSWQAFYHVTLPLLLPVIGAAALLVFIFCFTSFGVVLLLGGPRFATLEVEIYRQTINLFNLPLAATLSLIQIGFMMSLMALYSRLQRRSSRPLSLQSQQATQRWPETMGERLLVGGNLLVMLILLGTPIVALLLHSVTTRHGLSLVYYQTLFDEPIRRTTLSVAPHEAIFNSLMFASATVILATMLGLLTAVSLQRGQARPNFKLLYRLLDGLFMLPLVTSAVTLGFGFIITMNQPPLNLRTSPILVVIAHTLVALPFVIRILLPALQAIQPQLRESAATLGASPSRVWREVDWPLIKRAMLVGAVFAFTISMGEFGATVFISRPDRPTMPTAIFRLLDHPGTLNYGQALAMSSLLMVVCIVGFVMIERFRTGEDEEF